MTSETSTRRSCYVPTCRMSVEEPEVMCRRHWDNLTDKHRLALMDTYSDVREGTVNEKTFLDRAKAVARTLRRRELESLE